MATTEGFARLPIVARKRSIGVMLTVVLVEDNALLRSSLGIALGHHGVHVVASCADVSQAVEHLSGGGVDALVTDLDLGRGPNGIALAHAARTANPEVGVVLLTAYSDPRLVASKPGTYVVRVKVKRKNGKVGTRRVKIVVG